ncbi:MAG: DegT/DnrJ/EryC1/StrS family aminotransferase [Acidobacteria bacterium]|nr:DegT/DnrJ/EryC1/StrS family aminotransferase [Acidobacteriota bacterium]
MPVAFLDLKGQYKEIEAEVASALARAASSGTYVLGGEVKAFEKEWADFCHARGAATVGNGTDALSLSLNASGAVRPGLGDEVITPTLTSAYTALAILNSGGVPVFADIHPQTYTLDPRSIEDVITRRTRAILPVHLYGQLADMRAICEIAKRHSLVVIEDAAQSHGAFHDSGRIGLYGHAAAYSFYPTKNLGAFGDGGAVVSDDLAFIEKVKTLRQGGHLQALGGRIAGRNSRLDEIQAAVLRVKLKYLNEWNRRRREHASVYEEALCQSNGQIKIPAAIAPQAHVFHLYVIQHPSRDRLREYLDARGIETLIHYPYLLHREALFHREGQPALPVAESVGRNILSLPLYPQLKREEASEVVGAILDFEACR